MRFFLVQKTGKNFCPHFAPYPPCAKGVASQSRPKYDVQVTLVVKLILLMPTT